MDYLLGIDFIKINGQFSIFFYDISKMFLPNKGQNWTKAFTIQKILGVYFSSDFQSVKNLSKSYELDSKQISNYLNFGSSHP